MRRDSKGLIFKWGRIPTRDNSKCKDPKKERMPGMNEEKEVTNAPAGSEGEKVGEKHHGESPSGSGKDGRTEPRSYTLKKMGNF